MMRRSVQFLAVIMAIVVVFAQTQIATITSDSPFQLRGAGVTPGQGVPSWPVMPGDTIQAGSTPLTLTFQDGSTIIVSPGAKAKLDLSGKTPVFQLQSGEAHYSLKTLASVKLEQLKTAVVPKDLVGDLSIGSSKLAAGWWTTGHTLAVIGGAAGAAALAVGVAKGKSPSCSGQNQQGNNNCQGQNQQ
jgi:hypothetical protein